MNVVPASATMDSCYDIATTKRYCKNADSERYKIKVRKFDGRVGAPVSDARF